MLPFINRANLAQFSLFEQEDFRKGNVDTHCCRNS